MQKVKAEIHLNSIKRNAKSFLEKTGTKLCAVVKANAYGHGAEEVVNALSGIASCFAVALIEEAIAIRTAALDTDILVFTPPITEEEVFTLAANGFVATVPDLWTARLVHGVCEKYRMRLRVHLKTNTGMNRYGMNAQTLGKVCRFLQDSIWVQVEGLYSHLYTNDFCVATEQRQRFLQMRRICIGYYPNAIFHLSATYGSLLGVDFAFDMVRIGIGLYGYLPSLTEKSGVTEPPELYKAMTVHTVTVATRKPSYGGLGYGESYTNLALRSLGEISLCRAGYADGFLRKGQNGTVDSKDILGNLCMDVCIRHNKKRRGQNVALLIDAEETAKATGTISYEVLCAATRRAEFVYEENGVEVCASNRRKGSGVD